MDYASQFYNQLNNFMTDLASVCADDEYMQDNIQTFKVAYNLMRNMNNKKPIEVLMYYILPFREKILSGDDTFFLEYDFREELEGTSDINIMRKLRFKEIYKNLSDNSKEALKKYFKVLVILGEKSLGM